MKFLVAGLGSMGKRRIRCLKTLGYEAVAGFDVREDRRKEAEEKYDVKTYSSIGDALDEMAPTALIISVPPDIHHIYMKLALSRRIHFFVEASVVDTDMDAIKKESSKAGIVAAPSATLLFHPAIETIKGVVRSGRLGKVSNLIFHSGQYLPDWHTYERVSDYYVSNPATGGAREIAPFELSWITHVFGFPVRVAGNFRKTIAIDGAERIEDTYNFLMDYGDFLATVTIDVVSRFATRRLLINGDQAQLIWDWNFNCVKLFDGSDQKWSELHYRMAQAEEGYNQNIGENMYIDEIKNFIDAVEGKGAFVNSLEEDHKVLKLLYAIEESDRSARFVTVQR